VGKTVTKFDLVNETKTNVKNNLENTSQHLLEKASSSMQNQGQIKINWSRMQNKLTFS